MRKKEQGLRAALSDYTGAVQHLEFMTGEYKNFSATIKERESDLADCQAELDTRRAALSKPLESYTIKWEGLRRVPVNKEARRVYLLEERRDSLSVELIMLRDSKRQGIGVYTEGAKLKVKNATNVLFNAANIAAARMRIKPPLCDRWERLSITAIEERIAPLAEAESAWLAENNKSKARSKPAEEGEVREVKYSLENGGALIGPEDLYKAVKGAPTGKRDYILIGRGMLLPAKTLVDWLRLIADEPCRLWLGMNGKSGGAVVSLKAKIGKTIAEFIGVDWAEIVYPQNDRGGPVAFDSIGIRCQWRVNLVRAA